MQIKKQTNYLIVQSDGSLARHPGPVYTLSEGTPNEGKRYLVYQPRQGCELHLCTGHCVGGILVVDLLSIICIPIEPGDAVREVAEDFILDTGAATPSP